MLHVTHFMKLYCVSNLCWAEWTKKLRIGYSSRRATQYRLLIIIAVLAFVTLVSKNYKNDKRWKKTTNNKQFNVFCRVRMEVIGQLVTWDLELISVWKKLCTEVIKAVLPTCDKISKTVCLQHCLSEAVHQFCLQHYCRTIFLCQVLYDHK